jgi:hypothetical protein
MQTVSHVHTSALARARSTTTQCLCLFMRPAGPKLDHPCSGKCDTWANSCRCTHALQTASIWHPAARRAAPPWRAVRTTCKGDKHSPTTSSHHLGSRPNCHPLGNMRSLLLFTTQIRNCSSAAAGLNSVLRSPILHTKECNATILEHAPHLACVMHRLWPERVQAWEAKNSKLPL